MTFMQNQTLKDFMDIWAHEVVELRTSLEYARQGEHSARGEEKRQRELHKEQMARADRLAAQLTAEKKHTAKLQGIIDTLKIELENKRAEHTQTKITADKIEKQARSDQNALFTILDVFRQTDLTPEQKVQGAHAQLVKANITRRKAQDKPDG